MTPQELKNSVLQRAIQGKLVEQRPEEGTGEELYQAIQAEKRRLIQSGKLKKEKPLPEITEDEIPFDIPTSWTWVRLGCIGNTNIGLTYTPQDISQNGTIVLRSGNIKNGKMDYSDLIQVSTQIPENKLCHKGDILICARNGSKNLVGKAAIIDRDGMSFGAFMAVFKSMCNSYIFHIICSAYFRNGLLQDTGTTTINQITQEMLKNVVVPLPPLAEQRRIVAKIEELTPYIDRYTAAWNRLEAFNTRFPSDMRKSLLQMAIQGKLVEQRPEEGSAEELYRRIQAEKQRLIKSGKIKKDKPLPEITDDEIPFDIPDNWKWCRIIDCGVFISGYTPKNTELCVHGVMPYFTVADMNAPDNSLYLKTPRHYLRDFPARYFWKNTIVYPKNGGAVFTNKKRILEQDSIIDLNTGGYYPCQPLDLMYTFYFFCNIDFRLCHKGTALPTIDMEKLRKKLFPLPPLAEQRRIVARLEELLPLCERLR